MPDFLRLLRSKHASFFMCHTDALARMEGRRVGRQWLACVVLPAVKWCEVYRVPWLGRCLPFSLSVCQRISDCLTDDLPVRVSFFTLPN